MKGRPRGLAGVDRAKQMKAKYKEVGQKIEETQLVHAQKQLASFKTKLEDFAAKHKNEINSNPQLRHQFTQMCTTIGVDPLASGKGFWAELLGVGDFYYQLSVQVVDVCIATRRENGGLLQLTELQRRLTKMRNKKGSEQAEISREDIEAAIKKLTVLGNSYRIVKVADTQLVASVPYELSQDHHTVLSTAQATGYVTLPQLEADLGWPPRRSEAVMNLLLQEGLVWVDEQVPEPQYWFPVLFQGARGGVAE